MHNRPENGACSDATQGSKTGQTIATQTKAVPVKNEIRRGTVEELVRIVAPPMALISGQRGRVVFSALFWRTPKAALQCRGRKRRSLQEECEGPMVLHISGADVLPDPKTNKPLKMWENPWTKRSVPVMHVANDLVQGV